MCTSLGSGKFDGGLTSAAVKAMSGSERMKLLKDTQAELTKAKAAYTKAEKAYDLAAGAVIMTPSDKPELLAERRKAQTEKREKLAEADDKRNKLTARLDRYVAIHRRGGR